MGVVTTLAGAAELDPDESRRLLESLKQGEVLRLGRAPRVLSTEHPLDEEEVRQAGIDPSSQPIASVDLALDPSLVALVSQDCDLVRDIGREPYVVVAPLTRLAEDLHQEVLRFGSSRFFAYPPVDGEKTLALDMRLVFSIEKPALFASALERIGCPLTEPQRSKLRAWLGARFARVAFPDEIADLVVVPIQSAIEALAKDKNYARALGTIAFSGLRYTEGIGQCSLLLLVDPAACDRLSVDENLLTSLTKKLFSRINTPLRDSGYRVMVSLRTADEVSAAELLTHHALPLGDVEPTPGDADVSA